VKRFLARGLDRVDDMLARASLRRGRERPALLAFFFHGVFESAQEIDAAGVWPAQPLLTRELHRFIEYFQVRGYRFVSPAEVAGELDPGGYYALLTFDDGYANNRHALPILRALSAPATFFVSSQHVAESKAFWWDVVHRERRKQGATFAQIHREVDALKPQLPEAIEAQLRQSYGAEALRPVGEADRPFTAAELAEIARDPLVTVGNHGGDHLDLTGCDAARARREIRACQEHLAELTGSPPLAIAYPFGRHDARVADLARAEGLRLGMTSLPRKNQLPLTHVDRFRIGRAFVPCGAELLRACERCRSDLGLRRRMEALRT